MTDRDERDRQFSDEGPFIARKGVNALTILLSWWLISVLILIGVFITTAPHLINMAELTRLTGKAMFPRLQEQHQIAARLELISLSGDRMLVFQRKERRAQVLQNVRDLLLLEGMRADRTVHRLTMDAVRVLEAILMHDTVPDELVSRWQNLREQLVLMAQALREEPANRLDERLLVLGEGSEFVVWQGAIGIAVFFLSGLIMIVIVQKMLVRPVTRLTRFMLGGGNEPHLLHVKGAFGEIHALMTGVSYCLSIKQELEFYVSRLSKNKSVEGQPPPYSVENATNPVSDDEPLNTEGSPTTATTEPGTVRAKHDVSTASKVEEAGDVSPKDAERARDELVAVATSETGKTLQAESVSNIAEGGISSTTLTPESGQLEGKTKLTVMVVEDNQLNSHVVQNVLSKYGYTTVAAYNAREALDMYPLVGADIILMDLELPDMSGLEAAKQIRAIESQRKSINQSYEGAVGTFVASSYSENIRDEAVPILALTAHESPQLEPMCKAAGMNGVIIKPLNARAITELFPLVLSGRDWVAFPPVRHRRNGVSKIRESGTNGQSKLRAEGENPKGPSLSKTDNIRVSSNCDDASFCEVSDVAGENDCNLIFSTDWDSLELFDRDGAMRALELDEKEYGDLLVLFKNNLEQYSSKLQRAYVNRDHQSLASVAHTFKGECSNVGAHKAEEAALQVELAARSGDRGQVNSAYEECKGILWAMSTELEAVCEK